MKWLIALLLLSVIAFADVRTNSTFEVLCQFSNASTVPINNALPNISFYFPITNTTPYIFDTMTFISTAEGKYNYTVGEFLVNQTGFHNIVCNVTEGSRNYIQTANIFVTDNPINDSIFNISATVNVIEGDFVAWQIAISLGLGVLAFAIGFIGTRMDGKHEPLKALFLIFSAFIGLSAAGVMLEVATIEGQVAIDGILTGVYTGFVWFVVLLVMYFVLSLLFEWMAKAGKLGRYTR